MTTFLTILAIAAALAVPFMWAVRKCEELATAPRQWQDATFELALAARGRQAEAKWAADQAAWEADVAAAAYSTAVTDAYAALWHK